MSPKALTIGPYKFHFVVYDCSERMHIHVYTGRKPRKNQAKVWLEPEIELAWSKGFRAHEIDDILKHVEANRGYLVELWEAICGE